MGERINDVLIILYCLCVVVCIKRKRGEQEGKRGKNCAHPQNQLIRGCCLEQNEMPANLTVFFFIFGGGSACVCVCKRVCVSVCVCVCVYVQIMIIMSFEPPMRTIIMSRQFLEIC